MSDDKRVVPGKPDRIVDEWDDWPSLAEPRPSEAEASAGPPARFESWAHFLIAAALASEAKRTVGAGSLPTPLEELQGGSLPEPQSARWRRPRLLNVLVIAMTLGVLAALFVGSGDSDRTHHFPPPVRSAAPWPARLAGEYFHGASRGFRWSLLILSDGRFSSFESGCTGIGCRESGYGRTAGGRLFLPPLDLKRSKVPRAFDPIRWGPRDYLIAEGELESFCDAILEGEEPRTEAVGHFFLRRDDWTKEVSGVPDLPAPWDAYLRRWLIQGTITEIVGDHRARIDVGSTDGVKADMVFVLRGGQLFDRTRLRVLEVDGHSCLVVEDGAPEAPSKLRPGGTVVRSRDPQ